MDGKIPASLYWPDSQREVQIKLRTGNMPETFTRRMRTINLMSALVLRKIDPALIAPYDIEDLSHILDNLVSSDAIVSAMDNKTLADAIQTGNLTGLQDIAGANPLLSYGLSSNWLDLFFNKPFDPLCIMLAMRTKLLLDAIDQMEHSYNLLRSIGLGWIDWGILDGDDGGNPNDYYHPSLNDPLYFDPAAGQGRRGDPGQAPGQPSQAQKNYGGGLGGSGAIGAPSGLGPGVGPENGDTYGSRWMGGISLFYYCCHSSYDPLTEVQISFTSLQMDCGEEQVLSVDANPNDCSGNMYAWAIDSGSGELSAETGTSVTFTAPAGGAECVTPTVITLTCAETLVDSISIETTSCPPDAAIEYTTQMMNADEEQELSVSASGTVCGTPAYTWEITSGSGTLSDETGTTTTYTAPHTNAECANNPTITLSCNGEVVDTLDIAVNTGGTTVKAYMTWTRSSCIDFGVQHNAYCLGRAKSYDCEDTLISDQEFGYMNGPYEPACATCWSLVEAVELCAGIPRSAGTADCRNAEQKTAGCCPVGLL